MLWHSYTLLHCFYNILTFYDMTHVQNLFLCFLHFFTLFLWHSYTQMMRVYNLILCFITLILSLSYSVSTTLLNSHILFLWHYNTLSLSRPVSMTCLCSLTLFLWHSYIVSHDTLTQSLSLFLTLSHFASMIFLHSLKGCAYTISFSVSMTLIL